MLPTPPTLTSRKTATPQAHRSHRRLTPAQEGQTLSLMLAAQISHLRQVPPTQARVPETMQLRQTPRPKQTRPLLPMPQ